MNETTNFNVKEWKKSKLEAIRNYHGKLIKDLGISPFDFNMKKAFYDSKGSQVVGIFASEFLKEDGFFFELISSDLDPIDPQRKVYKIAYNPNFADEYELNPKNSYNVPLDEIRVVNLSEQKQKKSEPDPSPLFSKNNSLKSDDALFSEMTIRDYIAIKTGKPVSSKEWLNNLVTK